MNNLPLNEEQWALLEDYGWFKSRSEGFASTENGTHFRSADKVYEDLMRDEASDRVLVKVNWTAASKADMRKTYDKLQFLYRQELDGIFSNRVYSIRKEDLDMAIAINQP